MRDEIAFDGSPVAVYLALPAGPAPELIHAAISPRSSILELGAGVGRMTRVLVALGHRVVAVDDSAEMLEHVTGAERVVADVFTFDLARRFDVVVAASHLINDASTDRRRSLLRVCRRHLGRGGIAPVERFDPIWAADPPDSEGQMGPVSIRFERLRHDGVTFDAAVHYTVGTRTWTQRFTAAVVDDETLRTEAAAEELTLDRWLDTARTWAILRAT